ncbi:c6 transcription factor [Ophiostoma piceae UAMH 11346]|uniref:C6 transcription factor n=1 Tax=Ophiostoma piceae (strain UAMH 11346) TaxID=1262450 RepID=S3BV68_OPHP1|nr:c6 transcription factor [Ophiostoma piceae UAMH 11346]
MDGSNPNQGIPTDGFGAAASAILGAPGASGASTTDTGVSVSPVAAILPPPPSTDAPAVGLAALPGPSGPVVSGKTSYTALPNDPDNLLAEKEAYRELRRRARAACRICGLRKVRCDVTKQDFGEPCTNCRRDGLTCTVLPRKKHRPRRPNGTFDYGPASVSPLDGTGAGGSGDGPDSPQSPEPGAGIKAPSPEADGRLPDDDASTYMGDNRGPRQSVYDLCHPLTPQETRPPRALQSANSNSKGSKATGGPTSVPSSSLWRPHETAYLNHQGAFTPLSPRLLDDVMRVYFAHVHFFLPVLDAGEFVDDYKTSGWKGIDPLLGWSMCLAAANFVPDDVLTRAGYKTRKEMKEAMYARAKSLYDLDKATDKVTLIQSVLLIGFWYTDAHDHTGAWHWIGVAISLAQSLGFHRRPRRRILAPGTSGQEQDRRERAARRIWWTCLVRDRWVALAKGRPMRIHDEDCDVPLPVQEELMQGYVAAYETRPGGDILLPPKQATALGLMWLRLVSISSLLGRIVRAHYRAQGPRPSQHDIDAFERELQMCHPPEDGEEERAHGEHDEGEMKHILLHKNHADLFYYATAAILYRPYLLQAPSSLPLEASQQWYKTAARRARIAAASTNDVLNRLIDLEAVHLLKPMTITAFVPAMQIHLYDCKVESPLLRKHGKNKLDLCLLVLSEMRNTYWSASVIYRLFSKAQQILEGSSINSGGPGTAAGDNATTKEDGNLLLKDKYKATILGTVSNNPARPPEQQHLAHPAHQQHQHQHQQMQMQPPSIPHHPHNPRAVDGTASSALYNQEAPHPHYSDPDHAHQDAVRTSPMNSFMANVLTPTVPPPNQLMVQQPLPPSSLLNHQVQQQHSYRQPLHAGMCHPQVMQIEPPTDSNWWDQSQSFRDVDQLLSPGFSLSNEMVQGLFQNYNGGMFGPDIDMLYIQGQGQS